VRIGPIIRITWNLFMASPVELSAFGLGGCL
jgi:hypothetical protein